MALTYTYTDGYLRERVTETVEARALADINAIYASFSATWLAILVPIRAYVLVCLEHKRSDDDLFAVKLIDYKEEFQANLARAQQATENADGLTLNSMTFRIERA